jgi:glycosyltransferase involved in cell wall biosynthesis
MKSIALVTNIPAPYREKIHELISQKFEGNYTVIYCAEKESDREWKFNFGNYKKIFLSKENETAVHNNRKVWSVLSKLKPDVVVTNGFFPTMIYAFLWCVAHRKKHIVFTDGTIKSETTLSAIHRLIRKVFFRYTQAFVGSSDGSVALYKSYSIKPEKIFRTYLCVDNTKFQPISFTEKKYDLMFSGQFIERKLPFFFIEVARLVKEQLGQCKILLIGGGPLKEQIIAKLNEYKLDFDYPGFIQQEQLPSFYPLSKLFLFPTKWDPWGVVANEAMASGVPVITSADAGVANDLIISDNTGLILPLEEKKWAETIVTLLNDQSRLETIATNAKHHVQKYNHQSAADGFINAIESVLTQ